MLDSGCTIIDDLGELAPRSTQTELRSLLGCFLFCEDDVFKRIGVLSGGERNRYALARLLLRPSNFILLDEPTNHLDMRAKDVLLESLETFTGTLVFVSHDRYFLDRLATRVFEIGGGEVRVYPGNYEDYVWRKEGGHEQPPTLDDVLNGVPPALPIPISTPQEATTKRVNPLRLKQMQERVKQLEVLIAGLEGSILTAEQTPFISAEESHRLANQLEENRADLEAAMAEWENLTQQIEATA